MGGNIKTLAILALTFQSVIPTKRKCKTNVKPEKTKTQCRFKSWKKLHFCTGHSSNPQWEDKGWMAEQGKCVAEEDSTAPPAQQRWTARCAPGSLGAAKAASAAAAPEREAGERTRQGWQAGWEGTRHWRRCRACKGSQHPSSVAALKLSHGRAHVSGGHTQDGLMSASLLNSWQIHEGRCTKSNAKEVRFGARTNSIFSQSITCKDAVHKCPQRTKTRRVFACGRFLSLFISIVERATFCSSLLYLIDGFLLFPFCLAFEKEFAFLQSP